MQKTADLEPWTWRTLMEKRNETDLVLTGNFDIIYVINLNLVT